MKKIVFWLIFIVLFYTLIEGVSLTGLFLLKRIKKMEYKPVAYKVSNKHQEILGRFLKDESTYYKYDPDLGWSIKKNGAYKLYKSNSAGLRGDAEFSKKPKADIVRIAAFGDSFTHCDDVKNGETWEDVLISQNKNIEVMNFGVSGYGLDQAYLRYLKEGVNYSPDIVFIGYLNENIHRHVNTFRPFYSPKTGFPLSKPRYSLKNDEIHLIENPISEIETYEKLIRQPEKYMPILGKHDYYYSKTYTEHFMDISPTFRLMKIILTRLRNKFRPHTLKDNFYNEASEAYKVTTKIFDKFYNDVKANGSTPVIIIFPQRLDVQHYRKTGIEPYAPLLKHFQQNGYKYIDLMDVFAKLAEKQAEGKLFIPHYTYYSNQHVAKHLNDYLKQASGEGL